MEDTTKLNKSKLGTKKYWDDFYEVERKNFEENHQDTGECWFADNDAEERMIEFLIDNQGEDQISSESSIIDLGTGNGHLLFSLLDEGFKGKMVGVDYSEQSVEFANAISESEYKDYNNISFSAKDIFDDSWNPEKFNIVLDKGTLDAIALSGITFDDGKTAIDRYPGVIERLLGKGGILLITSCNFTEDELIKIIENDSLKLWKTINYPVFEFGGVKGSAICSVAFIKTS